jgi:hypothetical protein
MILDCGLRPDGAASIVNQQSKINNQKLFASTVLSPA